MGFGKSSCVGCSSPEHRRSSLKKALIAIGIIIVIGILVFFNLRSNKGARTSVTAEKVKHRDVVKLVTASGTIEPKRRVNVSASAMGKVTSVGHHGTVWVSLKLVFAGIIALVINFIRTARWQLLKLEYKPPASDTQPTLN